MIAQVLGESHSRTSIISLNKSTFLWKKTTITAQMRDNYVFENNHCMYSLLT